ncbi:MULTISPECIES: hypothetical protein [Lysinibacillus]|uniref:Uncharacterized protein n=2 Tax=Lysinibacillus sphaericus TaxID=1421 RepID=A0A6H0A051_LYSSH|nr:MULTISPECIES: hypothetical protein [Lysinibacillus]MBE5085796.1 hypothetical protein [Bacillus thuringiensis]ACA42357.1 hypothetical protein Bsph_p127 [Lysinibacillus sphaericus C3-41]AMO35341.1 hypothetical protein AR327_22890 [Lysinibacillus sphaericus]AMR93056.1 hypothetical protein A1T07_22895 [Lysinibacillus sphaericus]KGA83802.1 hypothetical protein KQ41_07180 [Lysinibacillus fusiformis]
MTENQRFELAVLLEKYSLINGMLVNGSTEQKKQAKKELQLLQNEVSPFLTPELIHAAQLELS